MNCFELYSTTQCAFETTTFENQTQSLSSALPAQLFRRYDNNGLMTTKTPSIVSVTLLLVTLTMVVRSLFCFIEKTKQKMFGKNQPVDTKLNSLQTRLPPPVPPQATPSVCAFLPIPFVGSIGNLIELSTSGFGGFIKNQSQKLGNVPIISTSLPGGIKMHFIAEPAAFSSLFRYGPQDLSMGPVITDFSKNFFGMSRKGLKVFGDNNRKKANEALHSHFVKKSGLKVLTTNAQQSILNHVTKLFSITPNSTIITDSNVSPTQTTTKLYDFVRKTIMYSTLEVTISKSECIVNDRFVKLFETFDKAIPKAFAGLPLWLAAPNSYKAREELVKILSSNPTKGKGQGYGFIPSDYLDARRSFLKSIGMTNDDISRDNLLWVWGATTNFIPSQFWHLYHVITNKDAFSKLRNEVDGIIHKRQQSGCSEENKTSSTIKLQQQDLVFTLEELDQMVGLESAFKESNRLTMTNMIMREVMRDMEIDLRLDNDESNQKQPSKYSLKKGSSVVVYPPLLHHNPDIFANPQDYHWDRFTSTDPTKPKVFRNSNGNVIQNPFCGFGGGAHYCPGRKLATNIAKSFVANLIYNYDIEIVGDDTNTTLEYDMARDAFGVLHPKSDVVVKFSKRQSFTQ